MNNFFGSCSTQRVKELYESIPIDQSKGEFALGPFNSENILRDAKRIGFMLARYKFVAKMMEGKDAVLEIGCQEGLGSLLVSQHVKSLVAVDFYRPHIESCKQRLKDKADNVDFRGHDMVDGPVPGAFDAAYTLDVLEHIEPENEERFLSNIADSLSPDGIFIVGIPSLEFQRYASDASKAGHINCKSGRGLRRICQHYFQHVFMFAMNDEVIHAGFLPMASYLLALCIQPKKDTA